MKGERSLRGGLAQRRGGGPGGLQENKSGISGAALPLGRGGVHCQGRIQGGAKGARAPPRISGANAPPTIFGANAPPYFWERSLTLHCPDRLALMQIHPDRLAKIMDESILKSFIEAQPRRMEFGGIENPFIAIFVLILFFYHHCHCGIYLFVRELSNFQLLF